MTVYAGEDAEKGEHCSTPVGVPTHTATWEISMVIPQKNGNQSTTRSSNSTCWPKDEHSNKKHIFPTMFIAALFVMARTWKQPR